MDIISSSEKPIQSFVTFEHKMKNGIGHLKLNKNILSFTLNTSRVSRTFWIDSAIILFLQILEKKNDVNMHGNGAAVKNHIIIDKTLTNAKQVST